MICCVTPKFVVSPHCGKEVSLADLLRKPLLPVMLEPTVWPPPGPMALPLAQLAYINMKGTLGLGYTST